MNISCILKHIYVIQTFQFSAFLNIFIIHCLRYMFIYTKHTVSSNGSTWTIFKSKTFCTNGFPSGMDMKIHVCLTAYNIFLFIDYLWLVFVYFSIRSKLKGQTLEYKLLPYKPSQSYLSSKLPVITTNISVASRVLLSSVRACFIREGFLTM